MLKNIIFFFIFLNCLAPELLSQTSSKNQAKVSLIGFNFINSNNIKYHISNNDMGAADPGSAGSMGFYYPANTQKSMIYQDGVVWSGIIRLPNGKSILKAGGSTYRSGQQPGIILSSGNVNGNNYDLPIADGSGKDVYKVYKIQRNWEQLQDGVEKLNLEYDYNHWPVNQGAPNKNGAPFFAGDQVLFHVTNDMDSVKTKALYGSTSIGLEVQTTVYALNSDPYRNSIFIRKLFINKSGLQIDSMYVSQWSDPDLGDNSDDFVGVDTTLQTAFAYNADNNDVIYGAQPPAIGYTFFQTPRIKANVADVADFNGRKVKGFKNQKLSSFIYYLYSTNPALGDPPLNNQGTLTLNRNQRGYDYYGAQLKDKNDNPTRFQLSGNPVNNTGDIDGIKEVAGDRRFLLSTGPFSLSPADSQEIVIGITVGQGSDRLKSISAMKSTVSQMSRSVVLDVRSANEIREANFRLLGNYPNPFNPNTVISVSLTKPTQLTVEIYNALGQKISTLFSGLKQSGDVSFNWNGKNEQGKIVPSGIYFYKISDAEIMKTGKMVLIK